MSKSDINSKSRIDLSDGPDLVRTKIKKAVSDQTSRITYDPLNRPGVSNLLDIYSAFTEQTSENAVLDFDGKDTVAFKSMVAEAIIQGLTPIQNEYEHLVKDPEYITNVLKDGDDKARSIAHTTLKDVKKLIGFV